MSIMTMLIMKDVLMKAVVDVKDTDEISEAKVTVVEEVISIMGLVIHVDLLIIIGMSVLITLLVIFVEIIKTMNNSWTFMNI